MSLRIWLPLNGNLENRGLLNIEMVNANAIIADYGKIGKCYYFNGTNARIYANNVSISNSQMSGCCWVKVSSFGSSSSYIFSLGSNVSGAGQQIGIVIQVSGLLYLTSNGSQLNTGYTLSLKTWYHICFTYKGNSSKLYVNGQLVYSGTNINSPKTQTCFCIGARSNSTSGAGSSFSYPFCGWINDVRIYNHCLSLQEIKKISQGLILHYPLNNKGFGKPNIIKGTNNFSGWHYTRTSYPSVNGKVMTFAASGTYWSDANSPTIPWSDVEGKTITVSLDIRSDDFNYTSGDGFYVDIARKSTGPTATDSTTRRLEGVIFTFSRTSTVTIPGGVLERTPIPTHWKRYSCTISNLSDSHFDHTYNGGGGDWFGLDIWQHCNKSVQIKNVKIEIGDSPTPWVPHVDDVEYNLCQVDNNKIADISGFNNNGNRVGTQFQIGSSSPVYKVATYIDCKDTGHYITSVVLPASDYNTYCFWLKTIDINNKVFFVDSFNHMAFGFYNYKAIICASNDSSNKKNIFTINNYITNEWNFIVLIKNNNIIKLFINNIEESETANQNNWSQAANNLWIGRRNNNTSNTMAMDGSISDFRVYCTALSENDITKLYKNRR